MQDTVGIGVVGQTKKEVWIVYVTHPGGYKHWEVLCDSHEEAEECVKFLTNISIPVPASLFVSGCSIECYKPLWCRIFHRED